MIPGSKRILQSYQAGENLGIDVTKTIEVKTKEKSFTTSIYPFMQTDHLYNQLLGRLKHSADIKMIYMNSFFSLSKARQNFDESSNGIFTYEDFSYKVVRIFFDQLHHVTTNEVSLIDALELMLFCNHEGQIPQGSDFETRLYEELKNQILSKMKDSKALSFVWMYLRSRGPSGRD